MIIFVKMDFSQFHKLKKWTFFYSKKRICNIDSIIEYFKNGFIESFPVKDFCEMTKILSGQ